MRGVSASSPEPARAGNVALVGRPNVGKSTLLNAAIGEPLVIVTNTPQTTRDSIVGVCHVGNAEIAFVDTPGLHKPRSALSRAMNRTARSSAVAADVVVYVCEVPEKIPARGGLRPHPGDLALLADIGLDKPIVLAINKVDRAADKTVLLPLVEALSKVRAFAAITMLIARKGQGVDRLLEEVAKLLPEGEHRFEDDDLTDRPARFFAGEYVREQVLKAAHEEVPHATAVSIDSFEDGPKITRISATIHVEREGQKRILIGKKGAMMRDIGTRARERIETLIGRQVFLELFVRVTPGWRESKGMLGELGYDESSPKRNSEGTS